MSNLLTYEEVATHFKLSIHWVKKQVRLKRLTPNRYGRVARFTETEVARFEREEKEGGTRSDGGCLTGTVKFEVIEKIVGDYR